MLNQLDIERALFPEDYKSMEADGKQVFYVEHENNTALTRGLAILISDAGMPMVSQQGLAPLATELNKIGWATVLLSAPTPQQLFEAEEPTAEPLATQNTVTTAQDTANTGSKTSLIHSKMAESRLNPNTFNKQQEELISLLKVAVKKVEEYPGFYLVIAQGSSAAWLTKIFAEGKSNLPDAFVAVSPFWADRSYNQTLPKIMAKTPMPVLDIYDNGDNDWVLNTVEKRQIAAVRSLKLLYRQRQLLGANQIGQQSYYLSKEIHGWLSHMGW